MTNVVSAEAKPALDYLTSAFRKPEYDARIVDTKYEHYFPISGARNTTCLRWTIPHQRGEYVPDIGKMVVALDMKCSNATRTGAPPTGIESGPCNNFINSIFASLRISYNTTTVLKIDHFPIYNYLRMMLNCDNNDLATWATNRLFYKEGENEDLDDIGTSGWNARREAFGTVIKEQYLDPPVNTKDNPNYEKFQYSTLPNFFMSSLDHYLPQPPYLPGVDIHVELELNRPAYCFQSKDDTEANCDINFDFEKCRLFVPKTKLNDKLFVQIEERLSKEPIRQFFTSSRVNTFSISTGQKTEYIDSIATGFTPSRLFVMLQETERVNGKFSLNSLKFPRVYNVHNSQPFLLSDVKVTLKGEEVDGLACDKSIHSFRDEYFRLCHLTKQDIGKNANSITFKDFSNHACFLVYDFTSTLNSTDPPLLPLVQKGHLRLQLTFDKPTTCPMTVITIVELQSCLAIEDSGKCTLSVI